MNATRISAWFEGIPEEWTAVAEALRDLLMEASPQMQEEWKYNLPFYSHRRWMCYLNIQKQGLVLGFVAGVHMLDPDQLFAPTDHKLIRHYLPSRNVRELPLEALRCLIQEAIALNDEINLRKKRKERNRS